MQQQGRGGNSFPDPFGGSGGFGFGRSMMMQDFFGGRDPFDDPFFTKPFGGFGGFSDSFFGSRPDAGFLQNGPSNHQESRRGPVIEEIDDHQTGDNSRSRSSREPIVEHPDDDQWSDSRNTKRMMSQQQQQQLQGGNGGFQSYSFQSSSVSYGGPNGKYYTSSTSRASGPNGLVHEEHHEEDSSERRELHRVSKGIYDKGRSLTRKRNADGPEETTETFHNLEESEVPNFEKTWETEAQKAFPRWNRNANKSLGAGSSSSGSKHRAAALPSSVRHA